MKDRDARGVVLVVEDEWIIRDNIVEELEAEGWTVIQASNAEDALGILGNNGDIDLLVTDIRLTGRLTGWDVAEAFRAKHVAAAVVYASGNPIEPSRQVSDSVFLRKPVDSETIAKTCRNLNTADR